MHYFCSYMIKFFSFLIINPSSVVMNHISPQIYNEIVITFYDQTFNALKLNNTELTITEQYKKLCRSKNMLS